MPRKTSEVTDARFPFASPTVPFILLLPEAEAEGQRGYQHANSHDKKYDLLRTAMLKRDQGEPFTLLAVWPGKTRSDVFEVDDLSNAMANMGATPEASA